MKKQIIASVCAFALALSVPAAAFAADGDALESVSVNGEVVALDSNEAAEDEFTITQDGDTANVEVAEDTFTTATGIDEDGNTIYENVLEGITIENAENVTVEEANIYDSSLKDVYGEEALKEYQEWMKQVQIDKGEHMFTVEINADVIDADKKAIVTFQLNKDVYGNKVVTYYVLHENGTVESKVVRVHADGTVRIDVDGFSLFTFMDVDDIQKYENLVEPQDGDELSPKTGF